MKKLTALFLSMTILASIGVTAFAAERPYKDVTEDDWYFSYVAKVYDDGLMLGTSKTTFAPNDRMTREQLVSVLARLADATLSDGDKSTFADVSSGKWYSSSIAWAQREGIVKGIDAKNFGLGQPVTREQMAVMLSNFVRNTDGFSLQKAEKPAVAYIDNAEVSSWAKAAVEEMRVYGIFTGDENGRFLPKKNVTRAECAKVLVCVMMANSEKAPYLSITETIYTDTSQTEMESICSVYDFTKKKLIYKGQVPYTSGYPLATYSSAQKSIFYSALSSRGDQLYWQLGKENEQMTNELCALNYIIQCDDKIFLAAKYLEHYCIEPIFFDFKNKELRQIFPDENDDRFTWTATCDPKAEKIYFSCYSDSLQRGDLEEYNRQHHTEETEVPECAPSSIYCVDVKTEKVTLANQTDDYIWGMAVTGDQLYYCGSKSSLSPKEEHTCFLVDLKTKEKTKLDIPVLISGDMAIWNNILYCIGWKDNVRGIYAIDLSTKNATLLYNASKNGFINGFSLNY